MKLKLLLVPLVALAGLLGISGAVHAAPAPPAQTFNVRVGDAVGQDLANQFLPQTITIHKGDSIHFVVGGDLHTVSYLPPGMADAPLTIQNPVGPGQVFNPIVNDPTNPSASPTEFDPQKYYNSGIVFPGLTADVHFNVIGSWTFICHIHAGMKMDLTVTGDPADVQSQADLDTKADAQRDAIVANDEALVNSVHTTKTTTGSASTWELAAGIGSRDDVQDVLQFLPAEPLKITTGDTVHWTSHTNTPHTVTFLNGAPFPDVTVNIQNPGNPPLLVGFNPGAILPSGGTTQDGSAFTNSGFIDQNGAFPGGTNYAQTFTKAGTYLYLCMLHQGMAGTIVVSDRAAAVVAQPTAPITAPNTGSGPDASGQGPWAISLAMIALAGAGVVVVGARGVWKHDA